MTRFEHYFCTKCGTHHAVARNDRSKYNKPKEKGHIKDIYCFSCQKVMKMKKG